MQKLYCYLDETGQDTKGKLFIVALVITDQEHEPLRASLEQIEQRSGKRQKKWKKTILSIKQAYLKGILALPSLAGRCFFSEHHGTIRYLPLMLDTLIKGVQNTARGQYKASVFIDALGRDQRKIVGAHLRRQHMQVKKVRGLRDESDVFIRLADALAGFVRDSLEGEVYAKDIYRNALKKGLIAKL